MGKSLLSTGVLSPPDLAWLCLPSPQAAVQSTADRHHHVRCHLQLNTGPASFSPEDLYIFSDRVFLARDPAIKVGHPIGRCTLIEPSTPQSSCRCQKRTASPLKGPSSTSPARQASAPPADPIARAIRVACCRPFDQVRWSTE